MGDRWMIVVSHAVLLEEERVSFARIRHLTLLEIEVSTSNLIFSLLSAAFRSPLPATSIGARRLMAKSMTPASIYLSLISTLERQKPETGGDIVMVALHVTLNDRGL